MRGAPKNLGNTRPMAFISRSQSVSQYGKPVQHDSDLRLTSPVSEVNDLGLGIPSGSNPASQDPQSHGYSTAPRTRHPTSTTRDSNTAYAVCFLPPALPAPSLACRHEVSRVDAKGMRTAWHAAAMDAQRIHIRHTKHDRRTK